MPIHESMLDDSILCSLSLGSHSDSTPLCSDSDCTFEHCQAAKNPKAAKQITAESSPPNALFANHDRVSSSQRQNLNLFAVRQAIRNVELVQRSNKYGAASTVSVGKAIARAPPGFGFERKDQHFSKSLQQIPHRINQETRLGLNDVELFVRVMRAERMYIDATYLDVVLDPVVAQFLWNTIGTPLLDNYPDLLFLRHQLGRRVRDQVEKFAQDNLHFATQRAHHHQLSIDDLPHIHQILSEVKATPKPLKDNGFGIDRTSMYKCRRSDPYMATIQTAIYSEPQSLPINFHKAAEDFALLDNPFAASFVDEPPKPPIMHTMHGKSVDPRQPSVASFFFKPNAVPFKPSVSSTPIKHKGTNASSDALAPNYLGGGYAPNAYHQHMPCATSHMFVPWYNQQNSVILYPQTLLMASVKAPKVYPDMTNE